MFLQYLLTERVYLAKYMLYIVPNLIGCIRKAANATKQIKVDHLSPVRFIQQKLPCPFTKLYCGRGLHTRTDLPFSFTFPHSNKSPLFTASLIRG